MDKTEALFSIDVNSGSKKLFEDQEQNAFHFNMLAADEIVHQLRLRDIGGIIVVDFIDMDDKANQQALYDRMRELMEHDRAKHNIATQQVRTNANHTPTRAPSGGNASDGDMSDMHGKR